MVTFCQYRHTCADSRVPERTIWKNKTEVRYFQHRSVFTFSYGQYCIHTMLHNPDFQRFGFHASCVEVEQELSQAVWCFSLQNLRNYNPNVAYICLHQLRRPPFSPPHRDSQSSGSGQAKGNELHKWEHLTTHTVRQKNATVQKNWSVCGRQSMPLHFSTSPVNLRGLCRRTTGCPIHSVY